MSSKGVQRPSGQHGIKAGRSSIMKLATPEMIEAMKLPPPKGQLDILPQSFQGAPPPSMAPSQKKAVEAARENPLLMPGMGPMISISKSSGRWRSITSCCTHCKEEKAAYGERNT